MAENPTIEKQNKESEWAESLKQVRKSEKEEKVKKSPEAVGRETGAEKPAGQTIKTAGKGIKTAGEDLRAGAPAFAGKEARSKDLPAVDRARGAAKKAVGKASTEPRAMKSLESRPLPEMPAEEDEGSQATKLRQAQNIAKIAKGVGSKIPAVMIAQAAASTPPKTALNKGSKQFLRIAWKTCNIFYLNFHFVVKYIAGSRGFCHFGEEWAGGGALGNVGAGAAGGAAGAGRPKRRSIMLEVAEIALLLVIDTIIAAIFLGILYMLVTLFWIIIHPCEALKFMGEGMTNLLGPILGPVAGVFMKPAEWTVCGIEGIGKFFSGGQ